jgi:hypothetical protein
MQVLAQIDAWDAVAGTTVTLRAASHDDPRVCHAAGATWWPASTKLPTLRYDLFDGAFGQEIATPSSAITVQTEPWPNFARYSFADARFRLWTGDVDDPANSWIQRFDGRVTAQPQVDAGTATLEFAVDDRWLDAALLTLYAGTTGAEGPLAMKGQAKPLALGAPRYVPGKLIDSVNNVFQLSAYGAIQAVEAALERLVRFGGSVGDYASYAALVAAPIAAGTWGTCRAQGLVRFGAPTTGQVSFLMQGDVAGPDGWARKPGQLIRRLALLAGGTGKIDDASLNALDVARPYNLSLYVDEQTTARQLIQQIAASVNAVAGVSWLGKLFVAPVALGAPTTTLSADGSTLPPVSAVKQIDIAAPWQKLGLEAEHAWAVHALGDIAFTAPLLPLGLYSATTIYREGNLVDLSDGSAWLYVATTPGSGNAPPTSGTSNAWWSRRTPPTVAQAADGTPLEALIGAARTIAAGKSAIFYQSDPPSAAESDENDRWVDEDAGNYEYKRLPGNGRIAMGGTVVTYGGAAIVYPPWAPSPDQRIAQALVNAAGAQATADRKVVTFNQEATPVGEGIGDLWYKPSTGALTRWSGGGWAATADTTALNQHGIKSPTDIVVSADYTGAPLAGQLPQSRLVARLLGQTDVSVSTSYSVSATGGLSVTINNAPGDAQRGLVTLSAPMTAASGVITVSTTYLNVTLYDDIKVTRADAPPPAASGGGGGGGAPGSPASTTISFDPDNSGTFAAMGGPISVTIGSSGQVNLAAPLSYVADSSSDNGTGETSQLSFLGAKWQSSNSASGPWTDVAGEIVGSEAWRFFRLTPPKGVRQQDGNIAVTQTKTGLTGGATAFFRLVGRLNAGFGIASVTGTATATPV